ncbi:DNA polymerase III subunit chi [Microvirga sp. W0021]|uniref:DNA polymerase III subunit chi n=1 Tax=Hohaiivirga grylli TaxID=3133970 RepID=A0ABV0BHT8_9HYPH
MVDVWFYHLQRQPLEATLPVLLLKTVEKGWKAVVQVASEERLSALDDHLWTFSEESFLPHAPANEPSAVSQPIVLTVGSENPNNAEIRFLAEGSELPENITSYQRIAVVFDGNDPDLLNRVRQQWKDVKASGLEASYWQQNERGRWEQKA